MAVLLWLFLLLVAFITLLALSPQVRNQVLIVTTYVSLTGWYYYRQWEKSHQGDAPASSRPKSRCSSSTSTRRVDMDSEADVRYFEPAEKVLRDAHEGQEENQSQRSMSENSYRLSEASSSGNSEDPMGKKNKKHSGGLFRKLRKSKAENQDETRLSDVSISSQASSTMTATTNTSSTRRTYSGRKKPPSWGN